MKKIYIALTFVLIILFTGCATTTTTQLTPEERAALETTIFKAPYKDVFKAVMEVFQDRGFILQNVDGDMGLITTEWRELGSESGEAFLEALVGEIRTKMTANITEIDTNSIKVRLQGIRQVSSGLKGWDGYPLTKAQSEQVYELYFKLISEKLNL